MESKKAFCLWSGGKDSHLAFMQAQAQEYQVVLLLTFFDEVTRLSLSHRLPARLLREQAKLLGFYLQEAYVRRDEYEQRLRSIMNSLAPQGIAYAIFGDIYLEEHRAWNERICAECGITPVFPLWGKSVESIFEEQRTFRSLIVSVEPQKVAEHWLGKYVDNRFREALLSKGLDICGEKGEYHTLVVQSPAMRGALRVQQWKKQFYDTYVGIDIQEWSVTRQEEMHIVF